jgi:hypothetical protein
MQHKEIKYKEIGIKIDINHPFPRTKRNTIEKVVKRDNAMMPIMPEITPRINDLSPEFLFTILNI